MVSVHNYFLDKTALIASNRAHGCRNTHRQGGCHIATTRLSSAYRIEAMAKSSELRLKEFLGFHWSGNKTEGSRNLQEQPRPKRKLAQPRPKHPRAQPRPLSQAAKKQRSAILSLLLDLGPSLASYFTVVPGGGHCIYSALPQALHVHLAVSQYYLYGLYSDL